MAETTVLSELLYDIVPTWAARIEKYIPATEENKATIITPGSLSSPIEGPDTKMSGVVGGPATAADSNAAQLSPDFPSPRIITGESSQPQLPQASQTPDNKADPLKILGAAHGVSRMDSKPDLNKSRFSSIDGPTVYYDGESQKMLCDLWTAMNTKRGGLRKEMMGLKKRQAQPKMLADFMVETEEPAKPTTPLIEEGDSKPNKGGILAVAEAIDSTVDVDEDFDGDTAGEMLLLKMKMEREKLKRMSRRAGAPMPSSALGALPFKRARTMDASPPASSSMSGAAAAAAAAAAKQKGQDDEAFKTLLEAVDDNLDKACKVTETAAFVWLKGEVCEGHLRFILSKLKETAARIEKSGFVEAKKGEGEEKAKDKKQEEKEKVSAEVKPVPRPAELVRKKSDATMRDAPISIPVGAVGALVEELKESVGGGGEVAENKDVGYLPSQPSKLGIGMEGTGAASVEVVL